ncbi:MAG: crotonase/enoyl-CoA hydratase family protein [Deltaproteobacteria bacterium]|nr:crotonase/enoyl-CoA hydratase family protein [Deltaproteobacteria bacterium]
MEATQNDSWACATVEREGPVARVRLRASGKAPRMGPDFWRELPGLFGRLDEDPAVRAVVLDSDGEHFSYGLDLTAMGAELAPLLDPGAGPAARTELLAVITRMQGAITAVARCRKPVIAAVRGWCLGGGVDLITACDVRLCTADARFSVRETRLAMVADVGTLARLPLLVGEGVARELCLSGDDVDAARALRIGLVNDVCETPEALTARALSLASRIAANAPLTVQGVKQVLNARVEAQTRENLALVALWNAAFLPSLDLQEAFAAFVEKRPPVFRGT